MESHLKHLLKKYNLIIKYGPTYGKGYIVRTPDGYPDLLVVKEGLSDAETEKVILHEIGHAENDNNVCGSYKDDYTARVCSEHGANSFLIHERIKEYINLGYDAMNANYVNLAESIGVNDFSTVKYELSKYLTLE